MKLRVGGNGDSGYFNSCAANCHYRNKGKFVISTILEGPPLGIVAISRMVRFMLKDIRLLTWPVAS
jgi:hypothetical protein